MDQQHKTGDATEDSVESDSRDLSSVFGWFAVSAFVVADGEELWGTSSWVVLLVVQRCIKMHQAVFWSNVDRRQ